MRLVFLNEKQIGKILANPIYTTSGMIFIREGNVITANILDKLRKIGVLTVYIEDSTGITLQEVIDSQIKIEIINEIKNFLEKIKKYRTIDNKQLSFIKQKIIDNIDISENSVSIDNYVSITKDNLSELALHLLDVIIYVIKIATARQIPAIKIDTLISSALLHDIGKLFEQSEKTHYEYAYELIKLNHNFGPTIFIPILHLHERIDSKGPLNVPGNKLLENSQILHIANNYSNLLKENSIPYQVIEKLSLDALQKFDRVIFKDSINAFYSYPNGIEVILNDGRQGIVFKQNKGFPTRPTIFLPSSTTLINLTEHLTIFIQKVNL